MEAYSKSKNSEQIGSTLINNSEFFGWLYKRYNQMAELKFVFLLLNNLGWIAVIYALGISIFNVDVLTRSIFSFLGIVFLAFKIIDFAFTRKRKHQSEMLDIRKKLNDEKEREIRLRLEEVEVYEKETQLIQKFK